MSFFVTNSSVSTTRFVTEGLTRLSMVSGLLATRPHCPTTTPSYHRTLSGFRFSMTLVSPVFRPNVWVSLVSKTHFIIPYSNFVTQLSHTFFLRSWKTIIRGGMDANSTVNMVHTYLFCMRSSNVLQAFITIARFPPVFPFSTGHDNGVPENSSATLDTAFCLSLLVDEMTISLSFGWI